jgi:hypothetical protein
VSRQPPKNADVMASRRRNKGGELPAHVVRRTVVPMVHVSCECGALTRGRTEPTHCSHCGRPFRYEGP